MVFTKIKIEAVTCVMISSKFVSGYNIFPRNEPPLSSGQLYATISILYLYQFIQFLFHYSDPYDCSIYLFVLSFADSSVNSFIYIASSSPDFAGTVSIFKVFNLKRQFVKKLEAHSAAFFVFKNHENKDLMYNLKNKESKKTIFTPQNKLQNVATQV